MAFNRKREREAERELTRFKQDTVAKIRQSERVLAGFMEIEICMLGARSLAELLATLVTELPNKFKDVDCVTLTCFDPEYEMRRLLEDTEKQQIYEACFIPITMEQIEQHFPALRRPWLGKCRPNTQAIFFPAYEQALESMVIAPLYHQGRLIGTLNQGSRKHGHFSRDSVTNLLEHLSAVLALCIDNVISHERLKLDGLTDALTGVFNRRFFEQRLHDEVERWQRAGDSLVCMLADIDYFKQINDTYGHQAGDRVLQRIAVELGKDLRGSDVLARYGGEEFVLLLPATSRQRAADIAERLRSDIEQLSFADISSSNIKVTISIGLAAVTLEQLPAGQPPDQWLLEHADKALYQAKHAGRNRIMIATTA